MKFPFIYGAQYYRAPTPEENHWDEDLRRMAESGFNSVKYWAQWRWTHRAPGVFVFDDMDKLMDLAADYSLGVTINVIMDIGPNWVFDKYPDCRMVTLAGHYVEPQAVSCRQIGGYPGPCYNHPEAIQARQEFIRQLVARYAEHPAMSMWDMWNEPESCLIYRNPQLSTLLCYCDNCRKKFREWLRARYEHIEELNRVWGRCYLSCDDVELPVNREVFIDMVDWRLFHMDTLANEARWRIGIAKFIDKSHAVYLHPVPNSLDMFNTMTGVDDFLMAEPCDCFAGTTNGVPVQTLQTLAAGRGKVCYNVESHLRGGSTDMYPRHLTLKDFASTFIAQIGLGVRGFMHWQYRAETLGIEAPAWGLLDVDGTVGITHDSAVDFWKRLEPVAETIMSAVPEEPEAAIFKSTSNDVLNWCMHGNFDDLREGIDGYTRLLYQKNARITYVNDAMVKAGLPSSIKLLIMPGCYALDQQTADAIAAWVNDGGTLVCEAHTGAYDLSTGRHSLIQPGLGLADAFGLRECNAVAVPHLGVSERTSINQNMPADLLKAINTFGLAGGQILSVDIFDGEKLLGWSRYTELAGDNLEPLAALPGRAPCVARKSVGLGSVYYIGTLAGVMWQKGNNPGLASLIDRVLISADIKLSSQRFKSISDGVRVDLLQTDAGVMIAIANTSEQEILIKAPGNEPMRGIMFDEYITPGSDFKLEPKQAELLVPVRILDAVGQGTKKVRVGELQEIAVL